MMLKSKSLAWASACLIVQPAFAQQNAINFFETDVRPVLKNNCQACHNEKTRSSGLSLATRDSVLAGGNRGAALKVGSPAESLLVQAVEQSGDLKMPPSGKLQPEQIATIRRWIEMGAPWPADSATAKQPKGADLWSLRPVVRTDPPAVQDRAWVRSPIDQFILARLEKDHLKPSPEADNAPAPCEPGSDGPASIASGNSGVCL
jgi:hypothetical protein